MPPADEQLRVAQDKALENHAKIMAKEQARQAAEHSRMEGNLIEGAAKHLHDSLDSAGRQELNHQLEHFARYGRT